MAARLDWTKPDAWTEKPASQMRIASYSFAGPDGAEADVSVTSFPDAAGGLLANINRWRGQVSLDPVQLPEKSATRSEIAGREGWLVDFAGTPTGGAPAMGTTPPPTGPTRILGAIVPLDGTSWFFKMIGPDALVAAQRETFRDFVSSVRAVTADAAPSTNAGADPHAGLGLPGADLQAASDPHAGLDLSGGAPAGDPHAGLDRDAMAAGAGLLPPPPQAGFNFETPAGWQPKPPSAMRAASFAVPGNGAPDGDVSVMVLGGSAGGELANVNRWRGQLGLAAVDAATLEKSVQTVPLAGGLVFRVFELEGGAAAADGRQSGMLAAILPQGGRTWFVKLTGESALVAGQREAFRQFLRSFRFDQPAS